MLYSGYLPKICFKIEPLMLPMIFKNFYCMKIKALEPTILLSQGTDLNGDIIIFFGNCKNGHFRSTGCKSGQDRNCGYYIVKSGQIDLYKLYSII